MRDSKIGGIILAAGLSRRMGRLKQLLDYKGQPLLQWVVDAAKASRLRPVVLVLGYRQAAVRTGIDCSGVEVVENEAFADGQSRSLQAGIDALPQNCSAALFMLGDQPLVTSGLIDQLITVYQGKNARIVVPIYQKRRGNPVLIDRSLFPRLMGLSGDIGGRALFDEYADGLETVEIEDPAVILDVDTEDDYRRLNET